MEPPVRYMMPDLDPSGHFSSIGKNHADAIEQAGFKYVVNLSSWGAHRDKGTGGIVGTHYYEQVMNGLPSNVSITHIRPVSLYYNLLSFMPAIKYTGRIAAAYGGENRSLLVAPEDIAIAIAEELEDTADSRNIRYVPATN